MAEDRKVNRSTRRLILTTSFLLVGALITTAFAWSAVAFGSLHLLMGQYVRPVGAVPGSYGSLAPESLPWPAPVRADWPRLQSLSQSSALGLRWLEGTTNNGTDWDAKTHIVTTLRAGWPLQSLSWTRYNIRESQIETWGSDSGGLQCPPSWGPLTNFGTINNAAPRRLPLTPIWPAFIASTLLYATLAAALTLGPRALLRNHIRRRRRNSGRCTACGYPVSASTCPECGASTEQAAPSPAAG